MSTREAQQLSPKRPDDRFQDREEVLRPFLEDAKIRERRRLEAAAALVSEYEQEEGEITHDEIRAFQTEWLD